MSRAVTFLLTGSLLHGVLCGEWRINIPQIVQVLSGSCVTIPCSFDVANSYEEHFNDKCQALWTHENPFINENAKLTPRKKMTANLKSKDCTTTFNNMNLESSSEYYFRLECNNDLKYTFKQAAVNILVKADPPLPTLTPSTLEVKEGTSVSLMCSAPAPCWSHPPTLTWTPSLGESVETLQENRDKTKVMTSVVHFSAFLLHHGKKISCSAVYKKQDGSVDASAETSLTAVILFPPQILLSSDCIKTPSQVKCSCETVGNPSPTVQWYLDGLPVSQSGKFEIISETSNNTALRSIIIMNQPQGGNISTLLCRSFNSLGSASQQFCVSSLQISEKDRVLYLASIATLTTFLLVLICVLLFVIRAKKDQDNSKTQMTHELYKDLKHQSTKIDENEGPSIVQDSIYANADWLMQ